MNELLPCPWCGETPTRIDISEGSTYRWAIATPNCCGGVMGEFRRESYPTELQTSHNRAAAIEWWNTRATADGVTGL